MRPKTAFLICLFVLPACQHGHEVDSSQRVFEIYLTRDNVRPYNLQDSSYVAPGDVPFFSADDITSYTWSTHVMHISDRARHALDTLFVPVEGKSFCACVNKVPKYYGAFWITISSRSFFGTTIIQSKPIADSIRIGRGYPVDFDTTMPDPRNNAEVEAALRSSGKIR